MSVPIHHQTPQVASYALARWQFLAQRALSESRAFHRPKSLQDVEQFTAAYRQACTELARVRAFSPDTRLAEYIERAVALSNFAVYRRRRTKMIEIFKGVLFAVPRAIRDLWKYMVVSVGVSMTSALIAYVAVLEKPGTYYLFVGRELAGGRDPAASREHLASVLHHTDTTAGMDAMFSMFLFQNNTRVAFYCFAWGALLGLPTIYLLIVNGLMLGAMTAVYVSKGLGVEWFAWILPHGVPELGAIFLAGGAGLALGHRIFNPGNKPRLQAFREQATTAGIVAMGCVPLLFLAGLIEGIFRQSKAGTELRYGVFAFLLLAMGAWIAVLGRRSKPTA
ncbi:stage II sporulation protein M [Planctomycetota bacterium]|nr:stage II sporulation protein M [Planctomycetota bacterium]